VEFLVRLFRALANRRRIAILRLLCAFGEMRVSAIARATAVRLPNVSGHLAMLVAVGLVWRRRSGRFVYYSLAGSASHPVTGTVLELLTRAFGGMDGNDPADVARATGDAASPASDAALFAAFTAFTHPRRLQILRHLARGEAGPLLALSAALSMSPAACGRHVEKLERRRMVRKHGAKGGLVLTLGNGVGWPGRMLAEAVVSALTAPGR